MDSYGSEFEALPPYSEIKALGYGPGFPVIDALTTYLMVRELFPRRYVEIGSGSRPTTPGLQRRRMCATAGRAK